jgi:hypothetical protein
LLLLGAQELDRVVIEHVTADATAHKVLDAPGCRDVRVHRESDLRPIRENVPDAILVPHSSVDHCRATMVETFKSHTGMEVDVATLSSPLLQS